MSYAPVNQAYRSPYTAYGLQGDKYSLGSITCLGAAGYADGDSIQVAGTAFELDKAGDGVTPGAVDVDITAGWTATQVRDALLAAINEAGVVGAFADGADGIKLVHKTPGQNPTIIGTGGFVDNYAGMSGGALGEGQPARFGPVRAMVPTSGDGRMVG